MKLPDFGEIVERERKSFAAERRQQASVIANAERARRAIEAKQERATAESTGILAVVEAERKRAFDALKTAGVKPTDSITVLKNGWFSSPMSPMVKKEIKGWNMVSHHWETKHSEDANEWKNSHYFTLMLSKRGVIYGSASNDLSARPIELKADRPFRSVGGEDLGIDFVRQGLARLIVVAENAVRH